jgi:hypothetical protein
LLETNESERDRHNRSSDPLSPAPDRSLYFAFEPRTGR